MDGSTPIPSAVDTDILIVGAGPTGLVLALWLRQVGIRVRIIDKEVAPGTTSRALAVQARTLEFYSQLGIAKAAVQRGRWVTAANVWVGGNRVAHVVFGDMGAGLSPFPYAMILPQDEHERLLSDHLAAANVLVERQTELVGFEERGHDVVAYLRHGNGAEEVCTSAFLAGCDGARSTVRQQLGIGFPGGTYEHQFYVADVDATGPTVNGELHVALDASDFLVVFPLKGDRRARLIGTVRRAGEEHAAAAWSDVKKGVMEQLSIAVARVNWFSTYHVHHRVASQFRRGRAFLLGDAAHIHSPVGGQGMNTGIGDAVNLAWKLAAVLHGRATPVLLDSYEPERIAFARRLVATTDRAFTSVTSARALARFVRMQVVPLVIPQLVALHRVRRLMFRTVSQTMVNYHGSPLSEGDAGAVRGGDRLPWVRMDWNGDRDNFTPLSLMDWQIHVYGEAKPDLRLLCKKRGLTLYVFPWHSAMGRAGLRRNAAYLIRPDGYVALANPTGTASVVATYLDARDLSPGATSTQGHPVA